MDKDIKLAKIKAQQAEREIALVIARDILSNPVIELIGGFMLIQVLTESPDKTKAPPIVMGTDTQIILRTALGAAVLGQQLGKEGMQTLASGAVSALKAVPALVAGVA